MGHHGLGFVEVSAAGVEVPIESREVAARHFDAQAVPRREVVARIKRLHRHLVDGAWRHPDALVVAVAVPHALDGFVEVEGASVRVDVDHFNREVGVLGI